jgi:hypothetical protein
MTSSGVKNATRGLGCSLVCLAAWTGAVALLYALRREHGGQGTRAVLEAMSLLGWIGAVIGGWDAVNVEGSWSYCCSGCGTVTGAGGICPGCGARLVPSAAVRNKQEAHAVIAGGLLLAFACGLVAFIVARTGPNTRGGSPLRFGAFVAGLVAFGVMVWYTVRRVAARV